MRGLVYKKAKGKTQKVSPVKVAENLPRVYSFLEGVGVGVGVGIEVGAWFT